MFLPVTTRTGAIRVRWAPFDADECRLWLLLADPATLRPDDLHPERLLQHMIRLPVDPMAGDTVVHAPVGRTLGLCLVWRDAVDDPQSALPTGWSEHRLAPMPRTKPRTNHASPTTRSTADPPASPVAAPTVRTFTPNDAALTPMPSSLDSAPSGARGAAPAPALAEGSEATPAIAALAARLLATAPALPPGTPPPAGFGLQQPWYLGRLTFPADTVAPRVVVRRATFIHAADLHAWREAPPVDATPLTDDCNTIIDASADVGETIFYAVLEGPAPWRSLPLAPVGPPFSDTRSPCVFGDATGRLDAAILAAEARGADPMVLEILHAARKSC